MRRIFAALTMVVVHGVVGRAQDTLPKGEALQVVDTAFRPRLSGPPDFPAGRGPVVLVDETHNNFHTAVGRYKPFADLLARDGFRVRRGQAKLTASALSGVKVLVISNALAARQIEVADWHLPAISVFDSAEIATIVRWVRSGGALLLIADHMPFPGAVTPLAAALGVHFVNGFALFGSVDPLTGDYPIEFRRRDGTLRSNPVTDGRSPAERIDSLESFTGSAFWVDRPITGEIMRLPAGTKVLLPVTAWQFSDSTPTLSGAGLLQGAAFSFGRGRVGVFGEAGMFSAQRKGRTREPMGINAPGATQNGRFILNLLRWLAGPS